MPLPPDFDEWQHLKNLVLLEHNKAVRRYFKNQPDNDISTTKRSLKHACLMKETDTISMIATRQWLFEVTCGHTASLQTPIYGIPVQDYQSNIKFKPQIKLFFLEPYDHDAYNEKIPRAKGEITFRLVNESSETITRSDAERLARRIKEVFATPPFVWERGWYKATYTDKANGYHLQLLVKDKAEGEKVVHHVLQVQNHAFERDFFQFVEHDRTYSLDPGTHPVYGRTTKKPIRRRRVDVKFKNAQLFIWGMTHPINLVTVGVSQARSVIERV